MRRGPSSWRISACRVGETHRCRYVNLWVYPPYDEVRRPPQAESGRSDRSAGRVVAAAAGNWPPGV
jgi:hypothetical protein